MEYKKIELTEPIYELQEKEKPKQHYFVDLFYEVEDDNIKNFANSFCNLKKGQKWAYSGHKETLKFDPYSPTHLVKLFSCLQVQKRRTAYWKDKFKSNREKRKQKGERFLNSFQDDLEQDIKDNYEIAKDIKEHETLYPHLKAKGKTEVATANNITWNIYKEITGVEITTTDQNINLNLDADVKQQTTAEIKMKKLKELREQMDKMTYD